MIPMYLKKVFIEYYSTYEELFESEDKITIKILKTMRDEEFNGFNPEYILCVLE